eukprot:4073085-Amphidinium_carterae.1
MPLECPLGKTHYKGQPLRRPSIGDTITNGRQPSVTIYNYNATIHQFLRLLLSTKTQQRVRIQAQDRLHV